MEGMMKPVGIVVTLVMAVIAVTILNSSDLLNGGDCVRIAQGYGASATSAVSTTGAGTTAVTAAFPGSLISAVTTERRCSLYEEDIAADDNSITVVNGSWAYDLNIFPGFRQLALILPLIIVAVILYGAWRGSSSWERFMG